MKSKRKRAYYQCLTQYRARKPAIKTFVENFGK